jgi:HD-GYP domain-containing protein (c-di-GMP phosphodiesterase class II)
LTLERVFLGGMRVIEENDLCNWATGFLIHDIGKAAAVEYHEGEAAYNRDIVMEHVKVGFTSVMNKTNYPQEAGLITGYHHEYYGDPGGYGFYRTFLEDYKKANPQAKMGFCIALDIDPINRFETLGYFPAKVLEIIDVYDSVTDPNRKYRKAMSPEEALSMMEEEFINKHHKIDIILFDIFAKFVRETLAD